jgi:hypothetical protein
MKRIDTTTKAVDLFGVGKPGFKDGDPVSGTPSTQLNALWFNNVQEEIANVIEGAAIALDPTHRDQLLTAINQLITIRLPAVSPYSRTSRALVIKNNAGTPTTKMDVTFDECILANTAMAAGLLAKAGAFTVDLSVAGAAGIDVGSVAAATWYNIYAISDGAVLKGVLSLSATGPGAAVLAAYPYYARLGTVRTAANSQFVGTVQRGRRVQYVTTGPNLTSLPLMASGTASALAVATGGFAPPTAASIQVSLGNSGGSAGFIGATGVVASNNSGTNDNAIYIGSSSATSGYVPSVVQGSFILESTNLYYTATVGSGGTPSWKLSCLGWEENI